MQNAFEKISNISGVLGAFAAELGEIKASSLPPIFGSDMLAGAASTIHKALETAQSLSVDITEVSMGFGDTRVVVAPLDESHQVVVFCRTTTEMRELSPLLRELSLKEVMDGSFSFSAATGPTSEEVERGLDALAEQAERAVSTPKEGSGSSSPTKASNDDPSNGRSFGEVKGTTEEAWFKSSPEPDDEFSFASPSSAATSSEPSHSGKESVDGNASGPKNDASRLAPGDGDKTDTELRVRIQTELARFVGPVASLLIADTIRARMGTSEAIDFLAKEIESEDDRQAFLAAVSALKA